MATYRGTSAAGISANGMDRPCSCPQIAGATTRGARAMDHKASDSIVTAIGIDIGKNTFHLVGLDERGAIVLRQKLSRGQVVVRLSNMPPCLVGMEACVGAHHLSRQ